MTFETLLCDLSGTEAGPIPGRVQLSFENPSGQVEGTGMLSFAPGKRPELTVNVERFAAEAPYDRYLPAFLDGKAMADQAGQIVFEMGGEERRFTSLFFDTEIGQFSASTGLIFSLHIIGIVVDSFKVSALDLTFAPLRERPPQYWLAPLIGPFEELTIGGSAQHVLALPGRQIYSFTINDRFCAVQPLDSGEDRLCPPYDAIAFGELDPNGDTSDPIHSFPEMLLNALRFAIGAEVQMPVLELRDSEAGLVRRVFLSDTRAVRQGRHTFSVIHSSSPRSGLAAFLQNFFAVDETIRRRIRVPLNLIRTGDPFSGEIIEDSITDLVKALDSLVRGHDLVQVDLLSCLSQQHREKLVIILNSARSALKSVRDSAQASRADIELSALDRIRGRLDNAATTDRDFGIAVRQLLDHFGLADAVVLDEYYLSTQNITYEQILSAARGKVIHEGHLGSLARSQLRNWFDFALHLHDLCKRLILKEVGYQGTYQPSTNMFRSAAPVDRIKPGMTYKALGFSSPPPTF
jgi:hypothetical protein